jgi:hypothetical protein
MTYLRRVAIAATVLGSLLAGGSGLCQSARPASTQFPLWKFDEMTTYPTCRAKGRLQDKEYCDSKLVDQVVAKGKAAIPILISQLTDNRPTRRPIYDYWHETTAGDVANFLLNSLFTDSDWKTFTMPGLDALNDRCNDDAETCWRRFLQAHGRKFVQDHWLAVWAANKGRIYWDGNARCFRLLKGPTK